MTLLLHPDMSSTCQPLTGLIIATSDNLYNLCAPSPRGRFSQSKSFTKVNIAGNNKKGYVNYFVKLYLRSEACM